MSIQEEINFSIIASKFDSQNLSTRTEALVVARADILSSFRSTKKIHADLDVDENYGDNFNGLLLEAVLLRYLTMNSKSSTNSSTSLTTLRENFEFDAVSFHIAQFMRDHNKKRKNGNSAAVKYIYSKLEEIQNTVRYSEKITCDDHLLTRDMARSLVRHLNQERILPQQIGILIRRLLGMLDDASITVRAAGVRAIGNILFIDPNIIDFPLLKRALMERVTDTGTMVRATAIDVLGQQISLNSTSSLEYYHIILDRLNDVGVSVRKRAITIIQDLVRSSNLSEHTNALKKLAFKVLDEDEGVQQLIVKLFRETWFTSLLNHKRTEKSEVSKSVNVFISVLWEVYYVTNKNGSVSLPLSSSFPVILILKKY